MADKQMQCLHQDRDKIVTNCDTTRNAVTFYFNQLHTALQQREKAVLNTVQKYTDIKLSTLDLHHQKLQEDHIAITRTIDLLEMLLQQNNSELDCSLLASSQMLEDELEVHQHSVLSVCDTLSQANFAAKFLSFSGDQVLSEPLKEAGVLNECQRIPDTNILSMQRVVVSEQEDPYLHVPSKFEDLQINGPQKEVRIDGRKKSQRVLNVSDMLEDDDVQYQIPRDFLGSPPGDQTVRSLADGLLTFLGSPPGDQTVRSLADGLLKNHLKVKEQPTPSGTAPTTIDCQPLDSEPVPPEPTPRKFPVPPPRRNLSKAPVPPPRTLPRTPTPGNQEEEEVGSSPPLLSPESGEDPEDVYNVPKSANMISIYDVPRPLVQGGTDVYAVPRQQDPHLEEDNTYVTPQNFLSPDIYGVPGPFSPEDLLPPPRPPKPNESGALETASSQEGHRDVPRPATSPRPKPRSTSSCRDYVNTKFDITARQSVPPVSPTNPSNEQSSPTPQTSNIDARSKPIPTPRPRSKRRSNTVIGTQLPPPPQSAPPVDRTSKPVFQWDGEPHSAGAAGKTLPPDMKVRVFRSTHKAPLTVLTNEQLGYPVSGEQVYPCGVCCSPITDLLVVTDVYNHCIRLVDPVTGRVIERIGKEGRSGGQFKEPSAVIMDSNEHIFVAELDNPRVQKFTSRGKYLLKFGQKAFWGNQLHDPYGLALSPDDRLYITDWEKGRVYVYQKDGRHVNTIGKDHAFLMFPAGLVFDKQGNLLVTDRGKHCVWVMTPEGRLLSRIGKFGTGEGELLLPHGIAVLQDNTIAVSESGNHRISIFAPNGKFIRSFGEKGSHPGMFHYPRHMCVDSKGQLIVADENNQRIQIFEVC